MDQVSERGDWQCCQNLLFLCANALVWEKVFASPFFETGCFLIWEVSFRSNSPSSFFLLFIK